MNSQRLTNSPIITEVRGYVLAGGQSRRMGADKAFLDLDGQTAVERQCRLLEPFCPQGVFIAGARFDQTPRMPWPIIQDSTPNSGPLAGIASSLQHAQQGIALILAVDLWAISSTDIKSLLNELANQMLINERSIDVSYAHSADDTSERGSQPLCAAWRVVSCLPLINQQLNAGERSVMKAWQELRRLPISTPESRLANINTRSEMENFLRNKG